MANATDLLAGGKDDVKATFGADSFVMMCIIIAELIVGVAMYIRTKNLLILLGWLWLSSSLPSVLPSSTDMEGNDLDKYRFPKTLSEQNRIIGLPLDEAIPAAVVLLWGFFTKKYLFSLIIAAVIWQLIRAAKRGKSSRWLYNWCYWYLPTELFRVVYRVIPDSSFRKWIK